jgi:hypothetical protein
MNKRSYIQPGKRPVTCRSSKANYAANALFRMLGLNGFDDDTSSSLSPWAQHQGGDAPTSLIPIRIAIDRRRHR